MVAKKVRAQIVKPCGSNVCNQTHGSDEEEGTYQNELKNETMGQKLLEKWLRFKNQDLELEGTKESLQSIDGRKTKKKACGKIDKPIEGKSKCKVKSKLKKMEMIKRKWGSWEIRC
ncbi:hypothetical protein QQP08_019459 [Theobroma cacao]|nr:hypothetical protein QQP08_019459 [Theobroma cacao]